MSHLSRAAVLACQAIRATWAVVATVPSTKEIWRLVGNNLLSFLLFNVKESSVKKQLLNEIFLGVVFTLLQIKLNTHFRCCTACRALRHTCQALCMAFAWKQPSFEAQNYLWGEPAACWENEEEIWSSALARGSPESRAVTVRATTLKSWFCPLIWD